MNTAELKKLFNEVKDDKDKLFEAVATIFISHEKLEAALKKISDMPVKYYESGYISEDAVEIAKEALK